MLRRYARELASRDAILAPNRQSLSFSSLYDEVRDTKAFFNLRGIGRRDRVAVVLPKGPEAATAFLSVAAFASTVPLNPRHSQSELEHYFGRIKPNAVVVPRAEDGPARRAAVSYGAQLMELAIDDAAPAGHLDWSGGALRDASDTGWNNGEDIALILLTSGTTARPKLVPNRLGALLHYAESMKRLYRLSKEDRSLHLMPMYHGHGLKSGILNPIFAGSSIVCLPDFEVDAFFEYLDSFRPTWYSASYTIHQAILRAADRNEEIIERVRSGLRFIRSGSGRLDPKVMTAIEARFETPMLERYGMSETGTVMTNPLPPGRRKSGTVGCEAGCEIALLTANGVCRASGIEGEILVRGVGVFDGYLDDAETNQEAFLDGWFRTGDTGRFDDEQYLILTGRTKDQINRGGEKISPREVETVLTSGAGVVESVVIGVPHPSLGQEIVALVQREPESNVSEQALKSLARKKLASFKVPRQLIFVSTIPKGPTGKVDRAAARTRFQALSSSRTSAEPAPRAGVEGELAAIWKRILHVPSVGRDGDFMLLGGDSLSAFDLLEEIEETFGVQLPADDVLAQDSSLAGMADLIRAATTSPGVRDTLRRSTGPSLVISKRDPLIPCPLTFTQERLLFACALSDSHQLYTVASAFRARGVHDVELLRRSINAVIARHDVLRAAFPTVNGNPTQEFAPTLELALPLEDLSGWPEETRDAEIERRLRADAEEPFDPHNGPLIRGRLLRTGPDEVIISLPRHHLVTDGSSNRILLDELLSFYRAFASRQPAPLAPLAIQFGDFAAWQRAHLTSERLDGLLEYWRAHLEGAPLHLALPTDHSRPARKSDRGGIVHLEIGGELTRSLRALGKRHGASLFMVLLAAFECLISRFSGKLDFIVGTAVAGRSAPETKSLIGLFLNTLALRVRLDDSWRFDDLLSRVREATLGALQHDEMPFDVLVDALKPTRDPGYAPVVQVLFGLMPRGARLVEDGDLSFERIDPSLETAKFDLRCTLEEHLGAIEGSFEYRTDLFAHETVRALVDSYRHVLSQVAQNSSTLLPQIAMMPPAASRKLIEAWSGSAAPYPKTETITSLFEASVKAAPETIAVECDGVEVTYRALHRWSNRLAARLRAAGIGHGSIVGINARRTPDVIAGLLGILKAGGAYMPLDPALPTKRLRYMLDEADVRCVVAPSGAIDLPSDIHRIDPGGASHEDPNNGRTCPSDAHSLAYLMFTSGSTGEPKGVMVEHRGVVRLVKGTNYARFGRDEVFLQLAMPAFDASTFEIWGCLLNGGRLVQIPDERLGSKEIALHIRETGATTLWLTAGLFHRLVDHELNCFEGVRQLLAGGDVLSPSHVRRFIEAVPSCTLINGYGPTENTTFTCTYAVESADRLAPSVPIGRPISNGRVYILDAYRNPVPIGMPGELYAAGDGLARGYLNRPELTADRFVPDPFSPTPGARMYRTSDRVRFLADGVIQFLNRTDDQVKLRGHRVELGEIEHALLRDPAVTKAAVVAREDSSGERQIYAFVVAADPATPIAPDLIRRELAKTLPSYMVPAAILEIGSLPLTALGKIDKNALPAVDRNRHGRQSRKTAPRTPVEVLLAEIWCEQLGLSNIGIEENFFDIGGHSLAAMKLLFRIAEEIGVGLPMHVVFDAPTIKGLSLAVTERMVVEDGIDIGSVP